MIEVASNFFYKSNGSTGRGAMRKLVLATALAAIVAAAVPTIPAFAQLASFTPTPGVVDNATLIQNTINAFPNGGPPLRMQLAEMIEKDPNLASDLAKYIQANAGMNPAQKEAAELGLADALDKLGVVAFAGPLTPALLGLVAAGGAGAAGAVAASKKSSCTVVSPNTSC
jgi:hypothetical protein